MRRTKTVYSPVDAEKERLKKELQEARRALFDLMPESVQRILHSYRQCKSSHEGRVWRHKIVEDIICLAKIVSQQTNSSPARGLCIMCGRGPVSAYYDGFSIPEGLRRHLEGYGDTRRCGVFSVLLNDVDDKLHEMFDEEDRAKTDEQKSLKDERMATEILYKKGPESEPTLVDDLFHSKCKSYEELILAEEKIEKFGFTTAISDRVKSYTRDYGDSVVYADPREKGRITFYVYTTKWDAAKNKNSSRRPYRDFYILDSWKHDIRDKYNARLVEARKGLQLTDTAPVKAKEAMVKKKRR